MATEFCQITLIFLILYKRTNIFTSGVSDKEVSFLRCWFTAVWRVLFTHRSHAHLITHSLVFHCQFVYNLTWNTLVYFISLTPRLTLKRKHLSFWLEDYFNFQYWQHCFNSHCCPSQYFSSIRPFYYRTGIR